jgi:glycerol kinase
MVGVLAIDQGTTGTTALVFDSDGRLRSRAYREIRQYFPRPGWVEHDPEEIYRSVIETSREAIRKAQLAGIPQTVGITNQRETFVLWERSSGRPLCRAIVWQCRRSSEVCNQMSAHEPEIAHHTGLVLDPYFSATKLKWLFDRNPDWRKRAMKGEICFGTMDTWLVFKLTKGSRFVTDQTNASRTMLMNLETCTWDPAMLALMEIPAEILPEVVPSRGPIADTAADTLARRPITIGAMVGDQQAALFGHGAVRPGAAKVTYGTGAFLLAHTGKHRVYSKRRLLATIALDAAGRRSYAIEGSIFMAGAIVQWLRDEMGLIRRATEIEQLARLSHSRGSLYLVPAFVGLGAPYWDSEARGALLGLTRGSNRADLAAAALDSIAYQVTDLVSAMEADMGRRLDSLRVDGGAAANNYLMQAQADFSGRRVLRPTLVEVTGQGAAMLAGLAPGIWKRAADFSSIEPVSQAFKPAMSAKERQRLIEGWHSAVARVLTPKARQPC